ncbi:MAG TPA: hypothetical protein EYP76_05495, partial [Thiomicrorhabdus sp.]|nr:hypothetical protein [Thiomicrorhabdus sp.]
MMLILKLRQVVKLFIFRYFFVKIGLMLGAVLFSSSLWANLTIEISEGYDNAIPIAIVPFGFEVAGKDIQTIKESATLDLAQVIGANLRRSGQFKPLLNSSMPSYPTSIEQIEFRQWRSLDIDNMLIGKLVDQGGGFYQVDMRFMDVLRKKQIL